MTKLVYTIGDSCKEEHLATLKDVFLDVDTSTFRKSLVRETRLDQILKKNEHGICFPPTAVEPAAAATTKGNPHGRHHQASAELFLGE